MPGVTEYGPTVVRWKFTSLDEATSYQFGVNPNKMGSFIRPRAVDVVTTTAPDGQVLLTEGARKPKQTSFGGVILDQAQHDAMLGWLDDHQRIYLDDHFGRRWEVFILDFAPEPKKTLNRYWRHDYTVTLLILSAPVYLDA